jgi:hypothetical protein
MNREAFSCGGCIYVIIVHIVGWKAVVVCLVVWLVGWLRNWRHGEIIAAADSGIVDEE